jgi:hypothetical protein
MNTETGQIYDHWDAIESAEERGEPLVYLSPAVYQQILALDQELEAARGMAQSYQHSYLLACGLPAEKLATVESPAQRSRRQKRAEKLR